MPPGLSAHSSTPQSHFHAVTHVTCFFPLELKEIGKSYIVFSLLLWRMQPWQPSTKVLNAKVNNQVENPEPVTLNMTSLSCCGRSLTSKKCTAHSSEIVRSWKFPGSPVVWAPHKPLCEAKKKKKKKKRNSKEPRQTQEEMLPVCPSLYYLPDIEYWSLALTPEIGKL